jgi:hypothetical protein
VRVAYCSLCGLPAEFCEYNTEVPHPSSAGGAQDAPAADAGASAKAKAQKGVAELSLGDGEGAAAGAASDGVSARAALRHDLNAALTSSAALDCCRASGGRGRQS